LSYTLIEPCCGSAALSVHLGGLSERSLIPYAGSKWRLRKKLADLIEEQGYTGVPERVILRDSGPWGEVWRVLLDESLRPTTLSCLKRWAEENPQTVYDRLNQNPPSARPAFYAAEYLFLQRFAYAGKPIREHEGFWKAAPFDAEAPFSYGETRDRIPALLQALEGFSWEKAQGWESKRADASTAPLPVTPAVVYLDPPFYAVEDFAGLAKRYADAGAFVVFSASELPSLPGWNTSALESSDERQFPQSVAYNDCPGPNPPSSVFDFFR